MRKLVVMVRLQLLSGTRKFAPMTMKLCKDQPPPSSATTPSLKSIPPVPRNTRCSPSPDSLLRTTMNPLPNISTMLKSGFPSATQISETRLIGGTLYRCNLTLNLEKMNLPTQQESSLSGITPNQTSDMPLELIQVEDWVRTLLRSLSGL